MTVSDAEDKFVCGQRGADIRSDWQTAVQA